MESDKKILCVGMCVLDIIHVCNEYPQEDTDKRCVKGHWQRGGNASNNCTVLRQLNQPCEFLGVLSNSKAFQFLLEDCQQRQIYINHCPIVDVDPPFSSVILNQFTNSRTIIHSNSNFPILKYQDFIKLNLFDYKWIHFEARNPEETKQMIESIHQHNLININQHKIQISIDLEKQNLQLLQLLQNVDYIFVSKEFAKFCNWFDPKDAVYGLHNQIGNKNCTIICPWGQNGCSILYNNNYHHINSYPPVKIIDTLGAGDTFCASTIYALNNHKNIIEAIEYASQLTGNKISFYGYDQIHNFNKT